MTVILNNKPHTEHLKSAGDLQTSLVVYAAKFTRTEQNDYDGRLGKR